MKKVFRRFLVIILIAIAIVSVSYTVIKDTENKKKEEERKKQEIGNVSVESIQNDEQKNKQNNEQNKTNNEKENAQTKEEDKKEEISNSTDNVNILTEPKDYSDYESNIEELIKEEENKNVLDDLKSGDNNLVYKNSDGSYYEYCFENDKIVNIYYYVECGNKSVAQYMLEAYTTEQMKELYSEAEIYKERAIKAKMSPKMIETYSNFTKEKLMNSMDKANNELKR